MDQVVESFPVKNKALDEGERRGGQQQTLQQEVPHSMGILLREF
jgi:hypothetical protein